MKLRVLNIVDGTTVDGEGLRTTIYFAGCNHHCHNCHNPQSWDINGGYLIEITDLVNHIIENDFDVTFSGGDPLVQYHGIIELAKAIKRLGKTIWCYTGYTYEEIISSANLSHVLNHIDILVDGRYIDSLRDVAGLRFRGSSNQRIIDVKKSIASGSVVEWDN